METFYQRTCTLFAVGALSLASSVLAADTGVVEAGAKLQTLAVEFKFSEGATSDRDSNVFFTDQPNDRIMRWSADGKLTTYKQPAGRANGMCFDKAGNLIACADEKNELWSIAPDGSVTVLASNYNGKALNGPNDVWIRPDGGMYITDPFYDRPWWKHHERPQDGEHVYFLSADRKQLVRVISNFTKPNGITGTPDGKTLYVADIGASKTYAFDIHPDGTVGTNRFFCAMGSDGMTIDDQGNLYLTGKGVFVFDRSGQQIEHIEVP